MVILKAFLIWLGVFTGFFAACLVFTGLVAVIQGRLPR